MQIFDSMKRGAARAAYEADRLLRLNRAETTANTIRTELNDTLRYLGSRAFELYKQGKLQPELVQAANAVHEIEGRLLEKEQEIAQLRAESGSSESRTPATWGHICPQCKVKLPLETAFCTECGSRAVDVARPITDPQLGNPSAGSAPTLISLAPQEPATAPVTSTSSVADEDGTTPDSIVDVPEPITSISPPDDEPQRLENAPAPPIADVQTEAKCSKCRVLIPAHAAFCPECGQRVA